MAIVAANKVTVWVPKENAGYRVILEMPSVLFSIFGVYLLVSLTLKLWFYLRQGARVERDPWENRSVTEEWQKRQTEGVDPGAISGEDNSLPVPLMLTSALWSYSNVAATSHVQNERFNSRSVFFRFTSVFVWLDLVWNYDLFQFFGFFCFSFFSFWLLLLLFTVVVIQGR